MGRFVVLIVLLLVGRHLDLLLLQLFAHHCQCCRCLDLHQHSACCHSHWLLCFGCYRLELSHRFHFLLQLHTLSSTFGQHLHSWSDRLRHCLHLMLLQRSPVLQLPGSVV